MNKTYRRYDVIAKMKENKIQDFSSNELNRVFKNCCSPTACKRAVARMIQDGLTIQECYSGDK